MGYSNEEAKTPIPPMEMAQASTMYTNLKVRSETLDPQSSFNVSSSPDSPLENPFHDDDKSSSNTSSLPDPKLGNAPSFKNTITKTDPSKTEAPSVQVMEHPTSSYRIPSSVFATSKSKAGMEWSVASNDSLFSIHSGNMSFTNDYYSFRMKELGGIGEASMSGQRVSQPSGGKVGEAISRELEVADARTKEVIREREDRNYKKSVSHCSDKSNMSTQSFAFPILKGGVQNDASIRMGSPVINEPRRQQSKTEVEHQTCTYSEPKPPSQEGNTTGASSLCSCLPCRSFF